MNYQRIYDQLISAAKDRKKPDGYTERHHIIPVCLGGGNQIDNQVDLTAEEHYVAHQLLVKIHPKNNDLILAAVLMNGSRNEFGRNGNKIYGWLKRKHSKAISDKMRLRFTIKENHPCFGKFGADHPHFGKTHSEETRRVMSDKAKGRLHSEDTKRSISEARVVWWRNAENKRKLSELRRSIFKGSGNPSYGKMCVTNGVISKRISKSEPIPDGFWLGLTMKRHSKREV